MPSNASPEKPSGSPLASVREQLIRRGMPLDYAERSVAELEDHHADLAEELRREGVSADQAEHLAEERLGEPKKLVRRIVRDYQQRTLLGRWPLISFVIAPPLLLMAGWIAATLVCVLSLYALETVSSSPFLADNIWGETKVVQAIVLVDRAICFVTVPALIAWWVGGLALRATRARVYAITACLLLGLMNGMVFVWSKPNPDDPTLSRMLIGIGLPFEWSIYTYWCYLRPSQVAQFVAPLAVGGWLIYRETKNRRRALRVEPLADERRVAA